MYPEATSYILPDLLALSTPFKGSTNPHYAKAAPESQAWVVKHHVFNERKGAFFRQCYFELLASHTFPYADYEEFRTICDFVNLIFVIDEVSDDQSGVGARETSQAYLNALKYPGWTDGSPIANMTAEFRERLMRSVGPRSFRRYVTHSENYMACTSREADYRETGEMLELEPYKNHRRENSAIQLCFALFEYCLGIDLPDEVFEDPVFARLYRTAADMVWLANDLYSYNMEQAKGHPANNIVTVLMRDRNCDLQTAMDIIGADYAEFMKSYLEDCERLPSFGPKVDAEVQRYITAMENWPIGNLEWSFGSNRYFGPMHDKVRRTRLVMVAPRREKDDSDDNSD